MRWLVAITCAVVLTVGLWTPRPPQATNNLMPVVREATPIGNQFDPAQTGRLNGRVTWAGPIPTHTPFPLLEHNLSRTGTPKVPNPNQPVIADDGGVANAIVYLNRVDLERSRPWDHPGARVEAHELNYRVFQGEKPTQVGIVRRGEAVRFVATEPNRHAVQARGASFFTTFLYDSSAPVNQIMPDAGYVELSSATGLFWCKAHLFVSNHPYVAVTGPDGRWSMDQVPAGIYEVRAMVLNWNIAARERNPDLARIDRIRFHPPFERSADVAIQRGETKSLPDLTLRQDDFPK